MFFASLGVYKDSNLKPKMKDIVIHNCLEFLTKECFWRASVFFLYFIDYQLNINVNFGEVL